MQWSGHRTASMLRRYHIIDLDDLRRAGRKASEYQGATSNVRPIRPTAPEPPQSNGNSSTRDAAVVEVVEC
jgi:hypothetical protein